MGSPNDSLWKSIEANNIGGVRRAEGRGADINEKRLIENHRFTPLEYAARQGFVDITRFLLTRASLSAAELTLICRLAIHSSQVTPPDMIELFLQKGVNPNNTDHDASRYSPWGNGDKRTLLMDAIVRGKEDIAIFLIELNIKYSARYVIRTRPNIQDKHGNTALFYAITYNRSNILIEKLLSMGENINLPNNQGDTPFLQSMIHSSPETIESLLLSHQVKNNSYLLSSRHLADVNVQNRQGITPLMRAARRGNIDIFLKLRGAGAEPDRAEKDGWTIVEFAASASYRSEQPLEMLKLTMREMQCEGDEQRIQSALLTVLESSHPQAPQLFQYLLNFLTLTPAYLNEWLRKAAETKNSCRSDIFTVVEDNLAAIGVMLLSLGADALTQENGKTIIMVARENNHQALLTIFNDWLLQRNDKPNRALPSSWKEDVEQEYKENEIYPVAEAIAVEVPLVVTPSIETKPASAPSLPVDEPQKDTQRLVETTLEFKESSSDYLEQTQNKKASVEFKEELNLRYLERLRRCGYKNAEVLLEAFVSSLEKAAPQSSMDEIIETSMPLPEPSAPPEPLVTNHYASFYRRQAFTVSEEKLPEAPGCG